MASKKSVEVWLTKPAYRDLDGITTYLTSVERESAVVFLEQLEASFPTLSSFPLRCPVVPEDKGAKVKRRHLIVGQYRVIYRLKGGKVEILRVIHGARKN